MAKKQMSFEQKMSKGHATNDKFVKLVCSFKSEKDTWKFSERFVRIPDGQTDDSILENEVKKMQKVA